MPRKQKTTKAKTLVDVVIAAGTEATIIPFMKSAKTNFVSVLVSHDKDGMSEWTIPLEDAIRLGFIDNPEKEQADE